MIIKNRYILTLSPLLAGLLILVVMIAGIGIIFNYTEQNKFKVLNKWEFRLSQFANAKVEEIENKMDERIEQIDDLAKNASLSLFLSTYDSVKNDDVSLSAMQGYVRNLLQASALRFGLIENHKMLSKTNLTMTNEYGLAFLDKNNNLLMSTKYFPRNVKKHNKIIEQAYLSGEIQIIDFYSEKKQQVVYGFVAPVLKVQSLGSSAYVGTVVMLLNPQRDLFSSLKYSQSMTGLYESNLIKRDGNSFIYLSVKNDGFNVFNRISINNSVASYFAYNQPGDVKVLADHNGIDVLVTGREIRNSSWKLVQKISVAESLMASNKSQKYVLTIFALLVVIMAMLFLVIWRHMNSLKWQALCIDFEGRNNLLEIISENVKDKIIILDEKKNIIFMNKNFLQGLSISHDAFLNVHVSYVLGKEFAELIIKSSNDDYAVVLPQTDNDKVFHIESAELSLAGNKPAFLYVLHDISELKQQHYRHEKRDKSVINALIKAADAHDPFCESHSERTRDVAITIAKVMNLTGSQLASLEVASILANMGKLHVSKTILTKTEALTKDESKSLKKHVNYAVDMFSNIEFEGPVLDIIAQKNECLDGSGYPKGLTSHEIMIESRILAVANSFVAMMSARAYRKSHTVKEVLSQLLAQTETQYDRQVVAALFHVCENKMKWNAWQVI